MKIPPTDFRTRSLRLIRYVGPAALGIVVGMFIGKSREPTASPVPAQQSAVCDGNERLRLSQGANKKNPIDTAVAMRHRLARDVEVVGSVSYDADHFAEVGALIAGRIVALEVGIGDSVKAGQVMAALESAEVGQAQACLLYTSCSEAFCRRRFRR